MIFKIAPRPMCLLAAAVVTVFLSSVATEERAEGSGHEEKPAAKSEHGGGGEHGGGEHGEAAAPAPAGPNRHYNPGPVEEFPKQFTGVDILTGETYTYKTKRGRVPLVFFVASWCESCQQLMPQIKVVANQFSRSYTDVIYIFAHDTKSDAAAFAKEHKLSGHLLLADHEILKAFKNPSLPAVYVGDRYNYIGNRFLKFTAADLKTLSEYMTKLTLL